MVPRHWPVSGKTPPSPPPSQELRWGGCSPSPRSHIRAASQLLQGGNFLRSSRRVLSPVSRHVLGSPGDQEGSGLSLCPDPAGQVASVWHSGLCSIHPGAPNCQCETATTIRSVPSPLITDHRGQRTKLSSGVPGGGSGTAHRSSSRASVA